MVGRRRTREAPSGNTRSSRQLSPQSPTARPLQSKDIAAPIATTTPQQQGKGITLLQFPLRFDGQSPEVETFVSALRLYARDLGVSEVTALESLTLLLTGVAAQWWFGAKKAFPSWEEALAGLEETFTIRKPPYEIYRELFSREQGPQEPTHRFIFRCRALLAQIPDNMSEKVQLDMVYGLLHQRVRTRIARSDVETFRRLLSRAREVEPFVCATALPSHGLPQRSVEPRQQPQSRPRCGFCKGRGHEESKCRKKQGLEVRQVGQTACDTCATPGVTQSECPNCFHSSLQALHSAQDVQQRRPIVKVTINGRDEFAFLDTGASRSIVSAGMYHHLETQNFLKEEVVQITLADGIPRVQNAKSGQVKIQLHGRVIHTNVVGLPDSKNEWTLLGVDFIGKAGIIIDVSRSEYHFRKTPHQLFNFINPSRNPFVNNVEMDKTLALREDEGPQLTRSQRSQVNTLLSAHRNCFAPGGEATDYIEHCINLVPGHHPPSTPPYRMPPQRKEVLGKEIEKMLEDGIIEECESPYAAPVVMVPKKDGSTRVCVDYRRLNEITINDKYPMPRIDDLLHAAHTTKYMTTLDLKAGYWQVSVKQADRDKTAFVSPFGTYRFKRMAFGLKNAPATFQRLIDRFRAGLKDVTILAYLDDLIVLSDSFEKHMNDLKEVFQRLHTFHLRINRKKSVFACPSVKYLGHLITPAGIQADPEKVAAIEKLDVPLNVKHLQSFLQTCSWYRRFVPNFSSVAKPLTDLTKKGTMWTWAREQQTAFEELKTRLTTAPILRQVDTSKPFVLRTDASAYAIGAALLQGEYPEEKPVEYASRLLTSAERNYSTTEREALAVVWAVNKFRGYIECSEVTIGTDHQPLRWLMQLKSPTGRLARWALQLQPYNLKIDYTPGKANLVADTLSRPPCGTDSSSCEICSTSVAVPTWNPADIRKEQLADPEVAKILTAFDESVPELHLWTNRGYIVSQGVLYRYSPEQDSESPQLVVPSQGRRRIMEEYHDSALAGHYGVEKTFDRISSRYYWPGMRRYVTEYIRSCIECQKYKPTNAKPAGLLQTPAPARRFETVAVDLFGPLPTSRSGNKWILIVEDTFSRWVELFPLREATAVHCAKALVEEVFLRYGMPRKMISDNGVQFISAVMKQVCHVLNIHQSLIPLYHPEANPVERRNRDLKTQLATLVGPNHAEWDLRLACIRFAMNSATCQSTGFSPGYLTFGRDLRTPDDATHDLKAVLDKEKPVAWATSYLRKLRTALLQARDKMENHQERQKKYADKRRSPGKQLQVGDLVLIRSHLLSNSEKQLTAKLAPRRDGPYQILQVISPTTYILCFPGSPDKTVGKYHLSDLTLFTGHHRTTPDPIHPIRRRGRPRKNSSEAGPSPRTVGQTRGGEYNS